MVQVATTDGSEIVRPLREYVPLIAEQFALAEKVGMDYYRAAGMLLAEVREIYFQGDSRGFFAWAEKNFLRRQTQIRTYIALVETTARKSFTSLKNFSREEQGHNRPSAGYVRRDWTAPVDDIAEKARNEARRLALEDSLTRQQERDADHKLALRLIDIGFKVLARELHPDKGGSRDAMARLNRVRDRLKECA